MVKQESSNRRQPLGELAAQSFHLIEIQRLQFRRDRAAAAGADNAAIELANRQYFGGGTGEERFVGDIDLIARDALLDQRDNRIPRRGGKSCCA